MFKKKTTPNRATYRTKKKTPRKHKANLYCLLAHGHEQAVQGIAVARPTRRHGRALLDCVAWGFGRPRSVGFGREKFPRDREKIPRDRMCGQTRLAFSEADSGHPPPSTIVGVACRCPISVDS